MIFTEVKKSNDYLETRRTLHDMIAERKNPYFEGIKTNLNKKSFLLFTKFIKLCCVVNRRSNHTTHKE